MRGVAQSGEGCAVGARRDFRHDQARRQGRLFFVQSGSSVRGCPTLQLHPEPSRSGSYRIR